MHIPDGYLSPATCGALYLGAAPFWYTALGRLKQALHTRMVPLVSLFSAFSFVVMMFNLPLPGGTTGHAVGIGIATVVLGPWGSMLAISMALAIQAIFFGDGGITAIGANCFNMAVVGSIVTYAAYRLLAGAAPIASPRRTVAAGLAGYLGINVAAFCAAVEFGLQPMFYRDAAGAPLYCPYPLSVAIPAMMIGHLTVAGLAEMLVSAGVVAFLQKADPGLLRGTAPGVKTDPGRLLPTGRATRKLWAAVATMMVLSPLGILAAGTAWGEWVASDFSKPAVRSQMAAASLNQPPPPEVPRGLDRLSAIWTAPIARYAPPYVRSAAFGYLLSAMFGVGVLILVWLGIGRVIPRAGLPDRP
jgi:cobalt/nickel transport system permease protein